MEEHGNDHQNSNIHRRSLALSATQEQMASTHSITLASSSENYIRWLILFLSCWIMFGNYYAFDNPSALNVPLRGILAPQGEEGLFQYRLSLLYSVYSIPNIVLPFWVGRWLDRLGSGPLLLALSFLVLIGQACVAYGIDRGKFTIVIVGRILFGLGGESLAVAQSRLVTEWFQGKELALAIGLNLSIARLGTVLNNILSPLIANTFNVPMAFWIGSISCFLSFLCTIATISMDKLYRSKHINSAVSIKYTANSHHEQQSRSRRPDYDFSFWLITLICFLFYVLILKFFFQ